MSFLLNSNNIIDYLIEHNLLFHQDQFNAQVTEKEYKNFNLLVMIDQAAWLVKQERVSSVHQNAVCEFWKEQKIYELFKSFPELQDFVGLTTDILYFDPLSHIIVLRYFPECINLSQFYRRHQYTYFPVVIATNLGQTLASIHSKTFQQPHHRAFLSQGTPAGDDVARSPSFLRGLARFGPGLFSKISTDGIEFWRLYQRYESLHQAVVDIAESYEPCCLTHHDLEFRNILIQADGDGESREDETLTAANLKIIDWELFRWGDPAHDLAIVLSSYVNLWLESLVVSRAIPMQMALQLATTPLERLQPSMTSLVQSYLGAFPRILEYQPHFLRRVMQFMGLVLIKQIQGRMEHLHPFDNTCLCTLQVAKMLLCHPEQSMLEIFGVELTLPNAVLA